MNYLVVCVIVLHVLSYIIILNHWAFTMLCVCIKTYSFQVVVIPPALAKFLPQAVECHVASRMDLTIAPDMDVILRVESVDRAR